MTRSLAGTLKPRRHVRPLLAEARREGHIEQATGKTRDEAFGQLCQMRLQDTVNGCP